MLYPCAVGANTLPAGDAIRNKNLAHIVRLGRGQVTFNHVLQLAGKDLAVCIAC